MKQKFSMLVVLFASLIVSLTVNGQESTRKFSKSWPTESIENLRITNKFGEVRVNNGTGSMITVDVVVTVEGSQSRANSILDEISVEFSTDGKTAVAETHMKEGFKSNGKFTINYTVNIPSEKNLEINNKFGNVVINKLTGKGEFEISYGNLTAVNLAGPALQLQLAYGKADIESIGRATVSLAYSKLILGTGTGLNLNSKYSSLNADKLDELQLESKYDTFSLGEINKLNGTSKYTNYKINKLNKVLNLESAYGTIKVEQIPAGFELLEVNSSYAQVSLGIEENAGYQVEAKCNYCNISYPEDKFKGNRTSENASQEVQGKVASGAPGKVVVTSRYGNIRLVR